MSKTPITSRPPDYWMMADQQREAHDARFLDKSFWEPIAKEEHIHRLEILLIHTLIGIDITVHMLSHPEYAERKEHLTGVLASFYKREQILHQLLGEARQAQNAPNAP